MDTQFSATQEYRTIVRPPSFGISVRGGAAMSRNAPASGVCAVLYMGSFVRVDQRISAEAAMAVQLRPKLRPQLSATNRVCLSVPLSRRQDQDLSFLLTGCSIIFRDSKKFMNTSPWQDFLLLLYFSEEIMSGYSVPNQRRHHLRPTETPGHTC